MNGNTRVIGLDFVRGVGAVFVMLQHSFEATGRATGWLDPFNGIGNLGQAGVVAFFLVSGYVIPMSLERAGSQRAFWLSRIFRIYPMYAVAFMATVVFMAGSIDIKTVVAHIFFVQEFVPGVRDQVPNSWTLSLELVWYISTAGLFALGLLRNSGLIFSMTCFAALIVGVLAWQSTAIPTGRFGMLVSCVIGLLLYRQMSGQSQEWWRIGILTLVVFALIAIAFRMEAGQPRDEFSQNTILAAWGIGYAVFFVGLLFGDRLPGRSMLGWLGRISFSVYLLHPFLIALAKYVGLEDISLMVFAIAATTAVSTLTYRFIELPAITYCKNLRRRDLQRSV